MGWLRRLRSTILPSHVSDEFDEERQFHIDELTDVYVREGLRPDAARDRARRRFGNLPATRERTRDADTLRWLADAAQDLRFAARTLRKNPGFAVVAILTLALGIGANTAIFTLFDALLLRTLPVRDPSRLVLVGDRTGEGTSTGDPPVGAWQLFSLEVYRYLGRQTLPFESLTAVRSGEATVLVHVPGQAAGGQAQRARAHLVAGNYFRAMGVDAALGRTLVDEDDRPNAPPSVVVSNGFWRQHLNANPGIVGTTVVLNKTAFVVAGVTPPEFFGERVRRSPDFWVPLAFQPQIELRPSLLDQTDAYWLTLIGRLAPGATRDQAQTAGTVALQQFLRSRAGGKVTSERDRDIRSSHLELTDGAAGISGLRVLYSQPLHVLLAVVVLVLLIACANVASLLLTRASARRGELSMRIALGAGRGRLARQLLTESLLLAALGAIGGVLIARWAAGALIAFIVSSGSPVHASINGTVLIFTIVIALAAGVLFGVAPALHASRIDLLAAMKTRLDGGTAGSRARGGPALVVLQIAVSLVLLVGAALFGRTLLNLVKHPLGFDASHVVLIRINPRLAGYTPESAIAMYGPLYDRLIALPGVRSATFGRYSPFGGSRSVHTGRVEGYTSKEGDGVDLEAVQVGAAYPETLGIPIVRGRSISTRDSAGGPRVGMVNEAFVRRYASSVNPIGRHFGLDDGKPPDIEIVGVIGDALFRDPQAAIEPIVFLPVVQTPNQFALDCEIELRTTGDTAGVVSAVRRLLAEIDPNLPVNDPELLSDQISRTFDSQRLA
ncbi:MAG TPA: ABC transporter permease, partial [Vicinamibacterales bacterium]